MVQYLSSCVLLGTGLLNTSQHRLGFTSMHTNDTFSSSVAHSVAILCSTLCCELHGYIHVCNSLVMRHNSVVLAAIGNVAMEDEASIADVRWPAHVHEGDKAVSSPSSCLSQRRC